MRNLLAVIILLVTGLLVFANSDSNVQLLSQPTIKDVAVPLLECTVSKGSGVAIGPNTILTAHHVIDEGSICAITRRNRHNRLTVTTADKLNDFAVLSPSRPIRSFYPINCSPLRTDETYFLVGHPLGISGYRVHTLIATPNYFHTSSTVGRIEHLRALDGPEAISGMSGGPLLNTKGEVVAILSGRTTEGPPRTLVKELADTSVCR